MSTSQDSKNLALLLWVGTFFFGFIPGLVLYLVKQDDKYVFTQAKESLNWCITAALGYVVAMILTIVWVGVLLFPVIGICHFVFCIMGGIATYEGKDFKLPFAVRLIK